MSDFDVVWCDFGGVLTPPISEAVESIVDATGLSWPVLSAAIEEVASGCGVKGLGPLELGLLTQREWAARVTAKLPFRPAVDLDRWDEYWYRGRIVNDELLEEVGRLRGIGVRVGLLTNSVREWEPHRARLLSGTTFDAVIRSHEVGIAKPDERVLFLADSMLPATGPVVLIDDLAANCDAAEKHGWSAIKHSNTATTIAALA